MRRSNYLRLAAVIIVLVTGCADESGCNEEYFTPKTVRDLAAVNTPEALLMASVIAGWDFVREKNARIPLSTPRDLRHRALLIAPNDQMLLNFLNNSCSASNPDDDLACSLDEAMKLKNLDPENGFYWANLAHYQLREGDDDGALNSYQRAASATKFSIGFGRQVYRFSMALKEAPLSSGSCPIKVGIGAAAGNLPAFGEFTKTCRAKSSDETWRTACLDLGRKMETQALTLVSRNMGFPLQRIVYEAMGDGESVAAIELRKERFRALIQRQNDLFNCHWEDSVWVGEWLLSMRDFDEVETMRLMSEASPSCEAQPIEDAR